MMTEILIIIAYFTGMSVPVATVAVFLRMDANPETARHLPEADSYQMPGEGRPALPDDGQEDRRLLGCDGTLSHD